MENKCNEAEFSEIADEIVKLQLTEHVERLVIERIESFIRQKVAPRFWSNFTNTSDERQGFELFKRAVDGLHSSLKEFLPLLKKLEQLLSVEGKRRYTYGQDDLLTQFKLIVRACLLGQLPLNSQHIIEHFYKIAFTVFCNTDTGANGNYFLLVL